ncbi:LPS export ABC transporter ATP-binding protein [bacterium]|nr:LPS export ABC transporter ATP-binding protein [bacterium]
MLRVRELKKTYRSREVVSSVSFDVGEGEIVGLLGRNGAGKTTTFRMTVGMIQPDAGRVELRSREGEWRDVTALPMYLRARAGMGYLAQEHSIFRDLSVEDNLTCILETLDLSRKDRRARRDALLEEYGLGKVRKSRAYRLSGGEMRRLEIARSLISEPRLMLLDEPFAGVDPIAVGDIKKIVFGLKERGISVFITDHNAREILTTTDRIYLMNEGQVLVTGTPREIVASADARRVYLGEEFDVPELKGEDESREPREKAPPETPTSEPPGEAA